MITDIDVFFADGGGRCARFATSDGSARRCTEALRALRTLCREAFAHVGALGHDPLHRCGAGRLRRPTIVAYLQEAGRDADAVILPTRGTRVARILAVRERILDGKGALER